MPRLLVRTLAVAAGLLSLPGMLAARQASDSAYLPAFEFHSGFWVNLHHFLYLQARLRQSPGDALAAPVFAQGSPPPVSLEGLSPTEEKAWNAAVAAYADWATRDLRNNDMALVNDRLAELEDCRDLLQDKGTPQCIAGLRPQMTAALNQAAPIYRARWWPQQDRQNRAWIVAVAPLVRRMGEIVGDQLITVYHRRWPPGSIRVDVVGYAGPEGAYTTAVPAQHITLSSADTGNQGPTAFEVLFREASQPLMEEVDQTVAAECRKQDKPIPREFLQALSSFTAGLLVQRDFAIEFAGTQDAVYTPYADRIGLFGGEWSGYRDLLVRYWQPYLEGQLSLEVAVSRMVASW